jgi:hypothetical protein
MGASPKTSFGRCVLVGSSDPASCTDSDDPCQNDQICRRSKEPSLAWRAEIAFHTLYPIPERRRIRSDTWLYTWLNTVYSHGQWRGADQCQQFMVSWCVGWDTPANVRCQMMRWLRMRLLCCPMREHSSWRYYRESRGVLVCLWACDMR